MENLFHFFTRRTDDGEAMESHSLHLLRQNTYTTTATHKTHVVYLPFLYAVLARWLFFNHLK